MECCKCNKKTKTFSIGSHSSNNYCAPCQIDKLYEIVQDMHIDLLNPHPNPCSSDCSQIKCRIATQKLKKNK